MTYDLLIFHGIIFSISFILTTITLIIIMRLSFARGIVGKDVHKPWNSYASEIGGVSLIIGSLIPFLFHPSERTLAFFISSLIALGIGLYDDLRVLSGRVKPILAIMPSLPVIILGLYKPTPFIPFIGEARLFLLYPIIVAIGYSIALNAINMSDTHNGLIAGISLIALSVLAPYLIEKNPFDAVIFISLIASLSAFLIYNAYPAKSFVGNSGSFIIGSWFASIAFISSVEFLIVLSLLPLVINGFTILVSIRGFKERREIKKRPVSVVQGFIYGNRDPDAPVTLANIASIKRPIREADYVISMYILILISSLAGLLIWILTQA
ncbi:MAG: hypothetical protein QXJ51_01365 [Sulfolobales archaeon]